MSATVAVVGDTLCGWIAAAMLNARLPRDTYRVVVVPGDRGGDGLGDFAPVILVPPSYTGLHAELGFDPGGAVVLGTAFSGWRADGQDAFLSFGERGAPLEGVSFRQLAGRLRAMGRTVRLADHSPAALAAQVGRDPAGAVPFARCVETEGYARQMREAALRAGVLLLPACTGMEVDPDGVIASLSLADGGAVDQPLLVLDCTGERRDADWEDWSRDFAADHCAMGIAATPAAPFAHLAAQDSGWQAHWPVPGGVATLTFGTDGRGERFYSGRAGSAWRGNRIALGAAACVLPPVQPVALELLLRALIRVIDLFPATSRAEVEAAAFNRATRDEQACARDLVMAPFVATGRSAGPPPPALAAKLALYGSCGRVPLLDGDLADEDDWAMLFDALGIVPRRYDALADGLPVERIEAHLAAVRAQAIAAVRAMPPARVAA